MTTFNLLILYCRRFPTFILLLFVLSWKDDDNWAWMNDLYFWALDRQLPLLANMLSIYFSVVDLDFHFQFSLCVML